MRLALGAKGETFPADHQCHLVASFVIGVSRSRSESGGGTRTRTPADEPATAARDRDIRRLFDRSLIEARMPLLHERDLDVGSEARSAKTGGVGTTTHPRSLEPWCHERPKAGSRAPSG